MEGNDLSSDIGYVKDLVEKADRRGSPASIYWLWAFICLAGFYIVDFMPERAGFFWMIAGPLGGILSGVMAKRSDTRQGQLDRKLGIRHMLHWGGMLGFVILAVMLAATGRIQGELVSQVIMLTVAFGWWTAGVHFDRNFLWLSLVMAAGYVASLFLTEYVWTLTGILMFIVLGAMALEKTRHNAR